MDANTESLVKTTVNGFIQKGYMFSAFDVTRFLRKGGERVRHNDTKDIVTEMFGNSEMGMYIRTTKDIGAPVAPFIYSHPYSDISNYSPDWIDANPNQDNMRYDAAYVFSSCGVAVGSCILATPPVFSAPVQSNQSKVKSSKLPDGVYKTTKEGRLNIPIDLVSSVSSSQSSYKFVVNSNEITILPVIYPSLYKVNKDGRIRVSRSVLNKISNGNLFKIEAKSNEIVVTPA